MMHELYIMSDTFGYDEWRYYRSFRTRFFAKREMKRWVKRMVKGHLGICTGGKHIKMESPSKTRMHCTDVRTISIQFNSHKVTVTK